MTPKRYRTLDVVRSELTHFPAGDLEDGQWYEWEHAPLGAVVVYVMAEDGSRRLAGRVENASGDQVTGEETTL